MLACFPTMSVQSFDEILSCDTFDCHVIILQLSKDYHTCMVPVLYPCVKMIRPLSCDLHMCTVLLTFNPSPSLLIL